MTSFLVTNSVPKSHLEVKIFDKYGRLLVREFIPYGSTRPYPTYAPALINVHAQVYGKGTVVIPYHPYSGPLPHQLESHIDIDPMYTVMSAGNSILRSDLSAQTTQRGDEVSSMNVSDYALTPAYNKGMIFAPQSMQSGYTYDSYLN